MTYEDIKDEIPRLENGKLDIKKFYSKEYILKFKEEFKVFLLPKEDQIVFFEDAILKTTEYIDNLNKKPKIGYLPKHIKIQEDYILSCKNIIKELKRT